MTQIEKNITALAQLLGITFRGEPPAPAARAAALVQLLKDFGFPAAPEAAPEKVCSDLLDRLWLEPVKPVLTMVEGGGTGLVTLRLQADVGARLTWRLEHEDGGREEGTLTLAKTRKTATRKIDGRDIVQWEMPLDIRPPCGYHRLVFFSADKDKALADATLVVAPPRCYRPESLGNGKKTWGISLRTHALRSRRNWGIGDFTDLRSLVDITAGLGAGACSLTPLHALTMPAAADGNPYHPSSRSFVNTMFIDVEAVEEYPGGQADNEEVTSRRVRLASLRDRDVIDYEAVHEIKQAALGGLWEQFHANHLNPETPRGQQFRDFQARGGSLLQFFSLFEALREHFRRDPAGSTDWHNWPPVFQDPHSPETQAFRAEHRREVEFHQYLQWQADLQLTSVGRRAMELGLKIGLVTELTYTTSANGFESWYYRDLYSRKATLDRPEPPAFPPPPSAGQPAWLPRQLARLRHEPLIQALRTNMRQAGALLLREFGRYAQADIIVPHGKPQIKASLDGHFHDLLNIIVLESRNNRCMVMADEIMELAGHHRQILAERGVLENFLTYRDRPASGEWPETAAYPEQAAIGFSASFMPGPIAFWNGDDLNTRAARHFFKNAEAHDRAIVKRAASRARLLISLRHADLLPDRYDIDPASVPEMNRDILEGLFLLLARTPTALLLVDLHDLTGEDHLPAGAESSFLTNWTRRSPVELEQLFDSREIAEFFSILSNVRGFGSVRPSPLARDRKKLSHADLPTAFYRLQMHKDFTFSQAADILGYLAELGISHCYMSPILKARPGSAHGYDIIDHGSINPEIGNRGEFERFISRLEDRNMDLMLDIVPNHMGVGSDNTWWMDILENGRASLYAGFFDINWHPQVTELHGKVLLPLLGDYYGRILENGELALAFEKESGSFFITYYEHRFPVAPETIPAILNTDLQRL